MCTRGDGTSWLRCTRTKRQIHYGKPQGFLKNSSGAILWTITVDITIVQDLVHITTAKDVGFLHNTGNWCPHLAFKCWAFILTKLSTQPLFIMISPWGTWELKENNAVLHSRIKSGERWVEKSFKMPGGSDIQDWFKSLPIFTRYWSVFGCSSWILLSFPF